MRTVSAKKETVEHRWYLVDLEGKVLGRAASRIASMLRGKHKPSYTPHVDTGDFVVAINAGRVRLTGEKWEKKLYYRHSGYPGGLKSVTAGRIRDTWPEKLVMHAVRGMLPKTPLGRRMLKKLKVYPQGEHPHTAQKPVPLEI